MERIIVGGTGFIGRHLVDFWRRQGKSIVVVGRSIEKIKGLFGNTVKAISWDELSTDLLQKAEVVVNLAGANVREKRWNETYKREMLHSRLDSDEQLVKYLSAIEGPKPPLLLASAISIYGKHADTETFPLDEDSKISCEKSTDFSQELCCKIENIPVNKELRVLFLRFGAVLAKDGGAFPEMLRPFKYGLGGKVGHGNQPFNWIAIEDLLNAIDFLLEKTEITGPVNFVAAEPLKQVEFAKALGKAIHRPALLPMPAFVMKLLFGEMSELFLEGSFIRPKVLLDNGYTFLYPNIEAALKSLLQ